VPQTIRIDREELLMDGGTRAGVRSDGSVTIMVPSYNYAQYLTECVESAAVQEDVEVVVVDNGSTDESPEIGRRLADEHGNVRFVCHPDNRGIIASFNRCRDEVRGEYAVLLCADDCLTPGSIARSLAFMRSHPEVGMVYGPVTLFSRREDVDEAPSAPAQPPIVHHGADFVDNLCRSGMNPIRNPEVLMRTSTIERVGRLDPRCPYTSDLNMWLRIAAVSNVAFLSGPAQALYRVHGSMHSGNFPWFSPSDFEQRWMAFRAFFETVVDSTQRWRWESLARRSLAAGARYAATRAFVSTDLSAPEDDANLLLAFAERIDPDATGVGERTGWALRRLLGPSSSRWFPGFLPRAAAHRAARVRAEGRRKRTGLYLT
jgi:glycosyltransferase involved in cell wall biosynthesis